ncbi:MAG: ABC transporter permease [Candidatus Moraniibacteriota bacterium]
MAWKNLLAAKTRTFLTILGIVIGIASVQIVLSIGESAQQLILGEIRNVGSNLIGVLPGASDEKGPPASVFGVVTTTLKASDMERVARETPSVAEWSGYVSGSATAKFESQSYNVSYQGVSAEMASVENITVAKGRFFTSEENQGLAKVIVLGSERAKDLFGGNNPIGERLSFGKITVVVIGVMASRGAGGFSNSDQMVFIPLLTAQKLLLGIDYLNFARLKVDQEKSIPATVENIRRIIREEHNIKSNQSDDFSVRNTADALKILTQVTDAVRYFLVFVASISLFVGGIGIMNIMLIALKQRIREVGLRKALGARDGDIQFQFIVEAVFLSLSGGVMGIILGVILTFIAALIIQGMGYDWQFLLTFSSVFEACAVAVIIGIIFGTYPARQAAKVSPMEALRYE